MDDNRTGDDLPPEPPKVRTVLGDILERTRAETEAETSLLLADLRAKEDSERLAREADEQRKREEAMARVEEERRNRQKQIADYEQRKRDAEERAKAAAMPAPAPAATVTVVAPKKQSRAVAFVAVGVVVAAAAGGAVWLLTPAGEPVVFAAAKAVDTARPGAFQSNPIPYGPASVARETSTMAPERVVAIHAPAKLEFAVAEPAPKGGHGARHGDGGKAADGGSKGPRIKIKGGILGGGGATVH